MLLFSNFVKDMSSKKEWNVLCPTYELDTRDTHDATIDPEQHLADRFVIIWSLAK